MLNKIKMLKRKTNATTDLKKTTLLKLKKDQQNIKKKKEHNGRKSNRKYGRPCQ